MEVLASTLKPQETLQGQPVSSLRYDWIAALLGCLGAIGGYQDLWAHTHVPQLETFFTPWHAVLYGSYLLLGGFLVGTALVNHRKGYAWLRSMPVGYELALLGVFVYAIAGVGDMTWHLLFGIEKSIDALLSPTHLLLGLGGLLMRTGPLRSVWRREESWHGWRQLTPMLLSLTCVLTGFMFFTTYADPFVSPIAAAKTTGSDVELVQALGLASIFLQTALLMGPLLLVVRRSRLPFGALMLVLTLMGVAVSVPRDTYYLLPVAVLAGLSGDLLLWLLRPSGERSNAFHLFAFAFPVVLYLLYFLELSLLAGVSWTIHMWMGAVVISGVVGLLLSYLLLPPRGVVTE